MLWLKSFLIVMILCSFSLLTHAEEHEGGGEHGGGEGGEAAAAPQNYSGKQDQKWEAVQAELSALKGKVDAQENVVQALIAQKSQVKGEALSALIEDIKKQHQKYEDLVTDYNKKNDEFLTRYPERGLKEKRVYKRVKMKSLNTIEADVSTSARLRRLHEKVLKQYPGVVDSPRSASQTSPTRSNEPSKTQKDVTESIELKK